MRRPRTARRRRRSPPRGDAYPCTNPRPARARRAALGALLATVLALIGLTVAGRHARAPPRAAAHPAVNLFQWTWNAIARECTDTHRPRGLRLRPDLPAQRARPLAGQWWTSYQPVSYKIESKLGTRAEYKAMIDTCNAAGVSVIVDAVINHMTGADRAAASASPARRTSIATPARRPYGYAGLQHAAGRTSSNYNDRYQVQNCRLSSLQDLDTGTDYVRARSPATSTT